MHLCAGSFLADDAQEEVENSPRQGLRSGATETKATFFSGLRLPCLESAETLKKQYISEESSLVCH